jgi:uncharacterized repeat protein (TIGR03943 family)
MAQSARMDAGRRARLIGARWLGVGLAAVLSVLTLSLTATGRLQLYVDPSQAWFAVGMAVLALAGAVASFALPLGAEEDHGHDHGDADVHGGSYASVGMDEAAAREGHRHGSVARRSPRRVLAGTAAVTGGAIATAFAVAAIALPPATLSVDLAMDRDTGNPPLFAGADEITLAATGDTSTFGVGEWSAVFATSANPDAFVGEQVTLTGFVTPDETDPQGLRLGRLVITHCVIDAQPASVPVDAPGWEDGLSVGDWVEVQGTVTADASGALTIEPDALVPVTAPDDPYEY